VLFCLPAYLLATLLALVPTRSAQAKVPRVTLGYLIRTSDYIVLARVEGVDARAGMKIARAVPLREFKATHPADSGRAPFYFVAEPTWTCDTSDAAPGETVLLFLSRVREQTIVRPDLGQPPVRVGAAKQQPLFCIAHSGRGRMPARQVNGKTYVTLWTDDVLLPPGIPTINGPHPGTGEYIRSALLTDMVREMIREPPIQKEDVMLDLLAVQGVQRAQSTERRGHQ
jgi:hypothetical protein